MAYNASVDRFRDEEYPMMKGKTYLDHAGTTIYSRSLMEQFMSKMISNLYGNPHSASDPAKLSGNVVDSIRERALQFVGADPEHFDLVFTANATAAIKLVSESFRDLAATSSTRGTFWYGYHRDSHTSLVGVREMTNGTHHCFVDDQEVEDWLNGSKSWSHSSTPGPLPGLFAYPGQSNMTGRRLPLSWTGQLRQSSQESHQSTYSLLDAAALATTTQLDFSNPDLAPDFTALSFYKIFGFPDLGALIVRRKSGHILSWRRYFGGGTVNSLTVLHEATVQRKDSTIHDALEDGTLPFHNILALGCALDVHKCLYGSMKQISLHTSFLSNRLYKGLSSICHSDGRPLCVIYNELSASAPYSDARTQGATIAFNVTRADGTYIGHQVVEQLANEKDVYLRAGGLCNAGGIASYLKVEPWQFKRAWSAGYRCGEAGPLEVINGKPTGVVRASLGAMSTINDVDMFLAFMSETFVDEQDVQESAATSDTLSYLCDRIECHGCKDSGVCSDEESQQALETKPRKSRVTKLVVRKEGPFSTGVGLPSLEKTTKLKGSGSNVAPDMDKLSSSLREVRLAAEQGAASRDGFIQVVEVKRLIERKKRISMRFWRGRRAAVVV